MKKIKELYDKLPTDEEIVFQVKYKKAFEKVIKEIKNIIDDKWEWAFIEHNLNYKDTYFILGNWRNGMFELRNGTYNVGEEQIHILSDYKEMPIEMKKHFDQIENIIQVMDKYREYFIQKKLTFNEEFNLVKTIK